MPDAKAGIYLNTQGNIARRVGVGVNAPTGAEWAKVTDDPNLGILAIREEARQKNLSPAPDAIKWEF